MALSAKRAVGGLSAAALLLALAAGACSGSPVEVGPGNDPSDAASPDADSGSGDAGSTDSGAGTPVVLGVTHTGWAGPGAPDSGYLPYQKKNCFLSGCHVLANLPTPTHSTGMTVPTCVGCHGANGACDANGGNKTDHTSALNCTGGGCHNATVHGFSSNSACVACHLSTVGGMRDCAP